MGNQFTMPPQIFYGENALDDSMETVKTLGKKAFIVSGKVMLKIGNVSKVTKKLSEFGIESVVYTEITGEPTDEMVENGLELYKKSNCDFFVGVGGGSPLDTMKAIAALVTNPGSISDYMGKTITNPVPPMVAIPTTAGTGSEATQFTIITDSKKNIKMLLKGQVLIPDVAIIDPAFTLTAPKSITAATGLDALTHAIESYTTKKAQPLTDTLAISAAKRIFKYLPVAYTDGGNVEARKQMSLAALEAGITINNASVTIVHGMSRPIGAMFHVPHGISNAMLMKECFKFALDGTYERFGRLGREIGAASYDDDDKTAAEALLKSVEEICKICEVPTLEEYGIEKEKFFSLIDKMATDAMASGSPSNTIKPVTKDDVIGIYKRLWE